MSVRSVFGAGLVTAFCLLLPAFASADCWHADSTPLGNGLIRHHWECNPGCFITSCFDLGGGAQRCSWRCEYQDRYIAAEPGPYYEAQPRYPQRANNTDGPFLLLTGLGALLLIGLFVGTTTEEADTSTSYEIATIEQQTLDAAYLRQQLEYDAAQADEFIRDAIDDAYWRGRDSI